MGRHNTGPAPGRRRVIEGLTVLATLALLLIFSAAGYYGGGEALFAAAALTTTGGFIFAVATGSVYHGLLYRILHGAGPAPRRWWLHPVRHHGLIPEKKRRRVMVWFHAGAAGFFVTLAGCALLLVWILLY